MENWPLKRAITISGSKTASDSEVADRLKRRGWELGSKVSSVEKALDRVAQGDASVIIIEDSPNLPLPVALRAMLKDINGLLTPTISIASRNTAGEKSCFGTIGQVIVVEDPYTPSKFIENFEFLTHRWGQDYLAGLNHAGTAYRTNNHQTCIKILSELMATDDLNILSVAGPALSLFFRKTNLKTAEKLLLGVLGKAKRNSGVILSLVDLYLRAGMPGLSYRLLKSANAIYNNPKTLMIDQIQTNRMLGLEHHSVPILKRMIKEKYMDKWATTALARILYLSGEHEELKQLLKGSDKELDKFHRAWSPPKIPKNKAS